MLVHLTLSKDSARIARRAVEEALGGLGRADLVDDTSLVVSELVTNGVLHARTDMTLTVEPIGDGIRVAVSDGSPVLPRWHPSSPVATSGRGLLLVERLSSKWGSERLTTGGKVVWAELDRPSLGEDLSPDELMNLWSDAEAGPLFAPEASIDVDLEIEVAAMLDSRAHTEDLVRELQMALLEATWHVREPQSANTQEVILLANRLIVATGDFHDARRQMLHQTLSAAKRGERHTTLHVKLHRHDAEAARVWLDSLEAADALTASGALLLPPFPEDMIEFRRYYIGSIIKQIEAAV